MNSNAAKLMDQAAESYLVKQEKCHNASHPGCSGCDSKYVCLQINRILHSTNLIYFICQIGRLLEKEEYIHRIYEEPMGCEGCPNIKHHDELPCQQLRQFYQDIRQVDETDLRHEYRRRTLLKKLE